MRIRFLDVLRGFSLVSMIFYHLAFDIYDFGLYPLGIGTLPFEIWRMSIAVVFITVSGICINMSRNRFRRALIVIGAAYLVTLATWLFDSRAFVMFGVLHCIGFSALIYALLKKALDRLSSAFMWLWLGLFIVLYAIEFPVVNVPHLYAFGFFDGSFVSSDYYPLLPYMFLFFFGASATEYVRSQRLPSWVLALHSRPLEFLGRHSLLIYLIHQPVLIGIMMLFNAI